MNDKELKGRLSAAGMAAADVDKDKSVDEAEFLGYADKLFDEATRMPTRRSAPPRLRHPPAGS